MISEGTVFRVGNKVLKEVEYYIYLGHSIQLGKREVKLQKLVEYCISFFKLLYSVSPVICSPLLSVIIDATRSVKLEKQRNFVPCDFDQRNLRND